MTVVSYTLADGTRGTFTAPSDDIKVAIKQTTEQLADDGEADFVITKTQAW